MSMSSRRYFAVWALALLMPVSWQAVAQSARAVPESNRASHASHAAAPLSPAERGALARAFVMKWGQYVQRVYDVPVGVWSKRMVSNFVAADAMNFHNALRRDTLEGALAELNGTGHRLVDAKVIDAYARQAPGTSGQAVAKALGDTARDLVFTAVPPCRIADTRVVGGAIAANSTRNFYALASAYTSQGGNATSCNVPIATAATAIAINVTAVTPTGAGYATVYPFATAQPLAASVNYTAGAIVNNSVVVGIPSPLLSNDFTIYTFAQSHYVIDIVGYFAPPQATPVQCMQTSVSTESIPAGLAAFYLAPACPTGYQSVSVGCWSVAGVYSTGSSLGFTRPDNRASCGWHNTTGAARDVNAAAVCCRVPGR